MKDHPSDHSMRVCSCLFFPSRVYYTTASVNGRRYPRFYVKIHPSHYTQTFYFAHAQKSGTSARNRLGCSGFACALAEGPLLDHSQATFTFMETMPNPI